MGTGPEPLAIGSTGRVLLKSPGQARGGSLPGLPMQMNASLGTPGHPTKDAPTRRGRDARKSAQDGSRTVTQSNPPNHGLPTHGVGRFLVELDPDTLGENWIETLPQRFKRWQNGGDPNQLPLTEVSSNE